MKLSEWVRFKSNIQHHMKEMRWFHKYLLEKSLRISKQNTYQSKLQAGFEVAQCWLTVVWLFKNNTVGVKWGQKPFLKHSWEKLMLIYYEYLSPIGEESSVVKWMYFTIIDIKFSICLMQFWDFMFIKKPFYCDLPSCKGFLKRKYIHHVTIESCGLCGKNVLLRRNTLTFCLYIRLMNLVNNIWMDLHKAEKRCMHHSKRICDSSWRSASRI